MSLIQRAQAEIIAANPDLNIQLVDETNGSYSGWALKIDQELDDESVDRITTTLADNRPREFWFMDIDVSEGATTVTVSA